MSCYSGLDIAGATALQRDRQDRNLNYEKSYFSHIPKIPLKVVNYPKNLKKLFYAWKIRRMIFLVWGWRNLENSWGISSS